MGTDLVKLPPQFQEGERAVLCACLLDSTAALRAMDELVPDDFFREVHRVVFRAILAIHAARQPIDWLTITKKLREEGTLDFVGGVPFLTELSDALPSAANVKHYIRAVKEKAILRRTIATCRETLSRCGEEGCDLNEVIQDHYRSLLEIGTAAKERQSKGPQKIRDVVIESYNVVCERTESGLPPGISTGFLDLDESTGGLHRGELTIVAARPGMGKTAFLMDLAHNITQREQGIVFSLEMTKDQLGQRFIARGARVNLLKLRSGNLQEWDISSMTDWLGEVDRLDLLVDFTPAISPLHVMLRAEELMLRTGKKLGLIGCDYLQLMRSSEKIREREKEVAAISRDLKMIAKQLDVPVVALCQLNRKVEERPNKRPQLFDLRESGSIEQDADNVLGLYHHHKYHADADERESECNVLKQRNGPVGTIKLRWIKEWVTFQDWEG